jgi:hypothetical protein
MINLFRNRTGAKLSLVLLSIFLFLLLFAPAASAAMMGDIDDSGSINVLDVVLAKQHVLGLQLLTPAQKLVADVNGSGDVDVLDVDLIMRKTLGLISEFPFVQLQVSTVTAINAKQIEVVFNKAVTQSLAENPANYEVYKQGALDTNVFGLAASGAVADLREDGKTVRLTLNTAHFLQNNTIANRVIVKKAVGLNTDYTNNNVALKDETVPTFISVRSVGTRTLELTFSEPVRTYPLQDPFYQIENVVLHDGVGFVGLALFDAQFIPSKHQVLIDTTVDLIPGRTYTLTLRDAPSHNLHDYVGLKVVPTSRSFTHAQVTSTPSVSAIAVSDKTLRIVFDRAVSLTTVGANVEFRYGFNDPTVMKRTSANMDGSGTSFAAAAVPGTGNKEYFVTFANPMTEGPGLLYIHYLNNTTAAGRIVDGFGNALPNNTLVNFTVGPVSERPTVISAVVVRANPIHIEVTFSEPVQGATNGLNYSLTNRFGQSVGYTYPTLKPGTTTTYVMVVDYDDTDPDPWDRVSVGVPFTLKVTDNIRDLSVAQNRLIPYSILLADPLFAAPYIIGAKTVGLNQVALTYSREVIQNTLQPDQFVYYPSVPFGIPIQATVISVAGNVITLSFPGAGFLPGIAYPNARIYYKQSGTSLNRVSAAFPVALFEHAVNPDEFRGLSSGF